MTKETKLMLITDERDEAMANLKEIYDDKRTSSDKPFTLEDIFELDMWHTEERDKIEKKYIQSIVELFEGEKA